MPESWDAVVANPPYTRWVEIPKKTRGAIEKAIDPLLREYGLSGGISNEMGIYIPFIIHGDKFLKDGRLGMIISNSWLQTDYGIRFANFLLDRFKVRAIIDFSSRLFSVPLIATLVILLEKWGGAKAKEDKSTIFMHIDKEVSVEEILTVIREPKEAQGKFLVNIIRQGDIPRGRKWIEQIYNIKSIEEVIANHPLIISCDVLFEARYGNVEGVFERGGTGGDIFFYLTDAEVKQRGLEDFVHPALISSRYSNFFTFRKEDWERLKKGGKRCYIFTAHKPKEILPDNIKEYIRYGETQLKTKSKKTCDQSLASKMREKKEFCGWYDLGKLLTHQYLSHAVLSTGIDFH